MSADIKFDTSDHDFQVYSLSETDRMGFIRKVYGILSVQLLLTTFFVILGCSSTAYQSFLENNTWLIISSMILNIVSICMLFCCLSNARKVPNNYILCGIFTLTESIMVSAIVTLYDP